MRIKELTLPGADLAAMRDFYVGRLGLAQESYDGDVLALSVGWTTLRFERPPPGAPMAPGHFAFNIPADAMDAAEAWLANRTPILTQHGKRRFVFDSWQAEAVYGVDPDGNIIELIGRRRIPVRLGGRDFDASSLLCVCEIGVVVSDPASTAQELCSTLGLSIFSARAAEFAAVGDDEGLLIVVPPERPWMPTEDVHSRPQFAQIRLASERAQESGQWDRPPYSIRVEPLRAVGRRG